MSESRHGMWTNQWLFVLAAAGSAVGLGNIWKFPYITGENGGGAFVLVYLACIIIIGLPVMAAEVLLGRHGRTSPINTFRKLVGESQLTAQWTKTAWIGVGWMGVLAGFLILSFYSVVAGWVLHYVFQLAMGTFSGADGELASEVFASFIGNEWLTLAWFTIFLIVTSAIVSRGVTRGLEATIRWTMPALFVLLFVVLIYSVNSGGFGEGASFLFSLDFSKLSWLGVREAMSHSFFTLSLGMGAIMAYGAYVPSGISVTQTVFVIAILDTLVALLAGLAIFPIVFANGLEAAAGPKLLFETLPIAFGNLPGGSFFGALFFLLVSFAAITSAISLLEPAIAFFVEQYNVKRTRIAFTLGAFCWILGIGSVFSFNIWSEFHIFGDKTIFDFVDWFTQAIMLPLGGVLIALFTGFVIPKTVIGEQLGISEGVKYWIWQALICVIAPISVMFILLYDYLV